MSKVLVIGDCHTPCMLKGYVPFLKRMQDKYECNRVVHIGDSADWHSISFHPKAPERRDPEREFRKAYRQMQQIYKAFPKVDYLIGNHSALPQRRAEEIGLPEVLLKDFRELWGVPTWNIIPRYDRVVIDGVIYQHGDRGRGGQYNSAYLNAIEEHKSVVQGHFHAQCGVQYFANEGNCIFGMQVGCGVDHHDAAMNYGRKFNRKPIVACGIVIGGHTAHVERMKLR